MPPLGRTSLGNEPPAPEPEPFTPSDEKANATRISELRTELVKTKILNASEITTSESMKKDVANVLRKLRNDVNWISAVATRTKCVPVFNILIEMLEHESESEVRADALELKATTTLLQNQYRDLQEITNTLKTISIEQNEKRAELQTQTQALATASNVLNSALTNTEAQAKTYAAALGNPDATHRGQPSHSHPHTHSHNHDTMPQTHADAIARGELAERRIIIKPDEAYDNKAGPLYADSDEKEIVASANTALRRVIQLYQEGRLDEEPATDMKFIAAKKIASGGAILFTDSVETNTWLLDGRMETFQNLHIDDIYAQQQYFPTIVEFVPVTFQPAEEHYLRNAEADNRLANGAITSAKWLKPESRRRPGQRVAHIALGFARQEDANRAIRKGIVLEGKLVYARRDRPKAERCLRCQQIPRDHNAANCKHDTMCGRCAGQHDTNSCTVNDQQKFRCVNCKAEGHGAADPRCPAAMKATEELMKRHPDMRYHIFPTRDSTTWERDGEDNTNQTQRGPSPRRGTMPAREHIITDFQEIARPQRSRQNSRRRNDDSQRGRTPTVNTPTLSRQRSQSSMRQTRLDWGSQPQTQTPLTQQQLSQHVDQ